MNEYLNFLNKHNIFDISLIEKFIDYHQRFLNTGKCNGTWCSAILKFQKFIFSSSKFLSDHEYVVFLIKGNELNKCEICGNDIEFIHHTKRKYCINCKDKYFEVHKKDIENKKKETCMKHFGVDSPMKSNVLIEKSKKTCLEKYGHEFSLQNKNVREKIKNTCSEKYGTDSFSKTDEFKTKYKETCLKKYGVDSLLKSEEVKEKIKKTFLEKYGVDNPLKNKEIKDRQRQTMIKTYGEEVLHSEDSLERQNETCLSKYGFKNFKLFDAWNHIINSNDYEPMFSENEFIGNDNEYKWKCKHCGNEFIAIYDDGKVRGGCPICLKGGSSYEMELKKMISSYFLNVKQHDRTLINPYELDIVIPEIKLAIEFNGNYWHSFKDMNYHLNKTRLCNSVGYRLIQIWEDEWNDILEKLKLVLSNEENLNFMETEIKLDRSWYNNVEIPGYTLKEEIKPEKVKRSMFDVWNCGYLVYERNKYN